MKNPLLLSTTALLLLVAQGSSDLILKPRLVTVDFAGTPVRRAYFEDGKKKFAVTIDNETELSEHGNGALFSFKKIPLATVELRRSPVPPGIPFTEEHIAEYAKAARGLLASNAEIWVEQPMQLDPLPINDWKTCRFFFYYRVGGSPIRADVTFIELDSREQVVVITGATGNDYAAVRERSDDIIRRWHEVTPENERGIN